MSKCVRNHCPTEDHCELCRQLAAAEDVCRELLESAEYWGEYDVPLGIVDRIKAILEKDR